MSSTTANTFCYVVISIINCRQILHAYYFYGHTQDRCTRPVVSAYAAWHHMVPICMEWWCTRLTKQPKLTAIIQQWRSQRGGLGGLNPPPFASNPFFHSREVTAIKYYNVSLTTRRTINSHNLRKTNHLGGAIASMVECVLTWIREQYLVVTFQNEPFCALLFIFNQ